MMMMMMMCGNLEGPTYSSTERVKELTATEGHRLTIVCTATGSSPISYEFFKVCSSQRRFLTDDIMLHSEDICAEV